MRCALAYVLRNAARHGLRFLGVDPAASWGSGASQSSLARRSEPLAIRAISVASSVDATAAE